ncbi:hypothetical protein IKF12_00340, partial [Candidatus Saccharibacteria bacterium]|nr:hypothetical protein [Candidatus Saccharibacteria bacterium]
MEELEKLKSELKNLNAKYTGIKDVPVEQRAEFGRKLNAEKMDILEQIRAVEEAVLDTEVEPIDITAPCAPNEPLPELYSVLDGSRHPLTAELKRVVEIYQMMGFDVVESRQLDDEYHMFDSLNFPKEHPARDGYDTFRTEEGLIPPAHTSTMQNRVLKMYRDNLKRGEEIAVVVPGRVYRNEDVDVTHEHTFYQCEGVYVSEKCTMGDMLGILREFFEKYYEQKLNIRTQPGYFPFTE